MSDCYAKTHNMYYYEILPCSHSLYQLANTYTLLYSNFNEYQQIIHNYSMARSYNDNFYKAYYSELISSIYRDRTYINNNDYINLAIKIYEILKTRYENYILSLKEIDYLKSTFYILDILNYNINLEKLIKNLNKSGSKYIETIGDEKEITKLALETEKWNLIQNEKELFSDDLFNKRLSSFTKTKKYIF